MVYLVFLSHLPFYVRLYLFRPVWSDLGWSLRKIVDYGSYYYISSEEHKITSDIEEQLMAVQELVDQGVV